MPKNDDDTSTIKVSVKNMGGYVLRTKHFKKNHDGTVRIKTKSFPQYQKKTFEIPRFSEIYLHAIASGGWSKCVLAEKSGCTVKCSRGSLNMNCYFTRKSCGHIRGIKEGGCRYAFVKYRSDDQVQPFESLNIVLGQKGKIILQNAGSTDISDFQVAFLNGDMQPDALFGQYFSGECLAITRLASGESCTLEYLFPTNTKLDPAYHVSANGSGMTHRQPLTIRYAHLEYLNENMQLLATLNAEPGKKGKIILMRAPYK